MSTLIFTTILYSRNSCIYDFIENKQRGYLTCPWLHITDKYGSQKLSLGTGFRACMLNLGTQLLVKIIAKYMLTKILTSWPIFILFFSKYKVRGEMNVFSSFFTGCELLGVWFISTWKGRWCN